jgi:tRNA(fMet)-specific endonuclease VapC
MKLCIDTNIYSAYKRGDSATTNVLEEAEEIVIPAIVLGELYAGFYLGSHTRKNQQELDDFLDIPGVYVADIDSKISEKYGYLVKCLKENGTPIPTNDIWIAATALQISAKLMTFDSHFKHIPGIIVI